MVAASGWHTSPAPELAPERLLELLDMHWGLAGRLDRLYAERDLNHRLTTPDGTRWLIKLSHPDATPARLRFEHAVLDHLSGVPGAPRVPGVLAGRNGASLFQVPGVGQLRVLDWLDGTALGEVSVNAALREALGRCCARLNQALAAPAFTTDRRAITPDPLPRDLPWDLLGLPKLAPLIDALPDAFARRLANDTLADFERDSAPRLPTLPRQLIHNDLNPDNVLVDEVTGALPSVIDFGDMVRAPVVCDLAIACAYHIDDSDEPLRFVGDIVGGFHSEFALDSEELALLPGLIAGRLSQTLLIQGARFAGGAEDQERSYRNAARSLGALRASDRDRQIEVLRAACTSACGDTPGSGRPLARNR